MPMEKHNKGVEMDKYFERIKKYLHKPKRMTVEIEEHGRTLWVAVSNKWEPDLLGRCIQAMSVILTRLWPQWTNPFCCCPWC